MFNSRSWALAAASAAALAAPALAHAGDNVFWSIGVAPAPGVYVGASNAPAPVIAPAPVWVQPVAPVVVAPRPVVAWPAPVYVQPAPVYVVRPGPAFVPPGHYRRHEGRWDRDWGPGHRHGRGDDDRGHGGRRG